MKPRSVLFTIFLGCLVALAAAFLNSWVAGQLNIGFSFYSRYVAPILEEALKAAYLVYLIRSEKVGFMVDAAIYGFAIGAGFAFVENIFYLRTVHDANILVWLIRGFGTAVMHSATTAIFGMLAKSLSDTFESKRAVAFAGGIVAATIIHSFYNHFFLPPVLITICFLVGLPLLTFAVFERSEQATRKWLGVGFDTDVDLLDMITTGGISQTRVGQYLESLKNRFPGEVVADLLCYLRIRLELAVRAKGILLLRQSGFETKSDPEIKAKFAELKYLQKSVGKTGKLAILPFLRTSSRDLWQLYLIDK
ncbi:MAG: PrsW family glutamic-type intramembrane protease [bacterium]